jgi:hypothetical protein
LLVSDPEQITVLQVPVPEEVIQLMARTFDEEKGHDWEHFATGLGWNRR